MTSLARKHISPFKWVLHSVILVGFSKTQDLAETMKEFFMITVLLIFWVGVIVLSYKGVLMALQKMDEL